MALHPFKAEPIRCMASRGMAATNTSKLQAWVDGPEFLLNPEVKTCCEEPSTLSELPPDFRPTRRQENYACIMVNSTDVVQEIIERCSTLHKLKKTRR